MSVEKSVPSASSAVNPNATYAVAIATRSTSSDAQLEVEACRRAAATADGAPRSGTVTACAPKSEHAADERGERDEDRARPDQDAGDERLGDEQAAARRPGA